VKVESVATGKCLVVLAVTLKNSNDFHVTIEDGKVNLRVDGADKFKMLEIEDVRADFDATMMLVAQAYKEGAGSVVEPEVFSMEEGDRG